VLNAIFTIGNVNPLVVGRASYVPSAAVDAETGETCAAGSGLHCSGDPAGDVQNSDGWLRRVFAGTSGLQRVQRRTVTRPVWIQPGHVYATDWSGSSYQTLVNSPRQHHPSFLPLIQPRQA